MTPEEHADWVVNSLCWQELTRQSIREEVAHRIRQAIAVDKERADDTEDALRSLACWLSAGGYNAPTVNADQFEEKIRWGVDYAIKQAVMLEREACAKLAEKMADEAPGDEHPGACLNIAAAIRARANQ